MKYLTQTAMMLPKLKILIADDHKIFADGLQSLLEQEETVEIMGIALNGDEVIEFVKTCPVDIILMDINMPYKDGIEASKIIREEFPSIQIIALSMYSELSFIKQFLEIGGKGYLLKNTERLDLFNAIEEVAKGKTFLPEEVKQKLKVKKPKTFFEDSFLKKYQLTKREVEIIRLLAAEKTTYEIADKLYISPHTVDTHRKNLHRKLDIKSTAGLVRFALENHLV